MSIARRLAGTWRRMVSHAAVAGGWLPWLQLAFRELRREGARRKLAGIFGDRAAAPVPERLPELDIRDRAATDVRTLRRLAFAPGAQPRATIIVDARAGLVSVARCLGAIARHRPACSFEVVLSDAVAADAAELARVPGIGVVAGTRDDAVKAARGEFVHLLDGSAQPQAGWLDALVAHLDRVPGAGAVGSRLLRRDGRVLEAGARIFAGGAAGAARYESLGGGDARADPRHAHARDVEVCSTQSLLIRRELLAAVGGLAAAYTTAGFRDADLAYRVRRAGGRIRYEPASEVVVEPPATGAAEADAVRFAERWGRELARQQRIRVLAFFLPQFHPIPENDAWWGQGFTEWTNVRKARPNFPGHDQPHVPGELGYYDLRDAGTRERQAALAARYGVHGFCYYYYWFAGKRLLHQPLDEVLASGTPELPFCVCWANENWTRTWDGLERHVLIAQRHSPEDDVAFIRSLLPLFRDRRYVRIDGKPLLLLYKPQLLPDPAATATRWRGECREAGVGELYLAAVHAMNNPALNVDPRDIGFDAAVEFPPAGKGVPAQVPTPLLNPRFRGVVYDYDDTARNLLANQGPPYTFFRGVMPSWDNTARRQDTGHVFLSADPVRFRRWLDAACDWTARMRIGDERLVFVNAWNEWAEGNHLEPDQKHGHAYLEATRAALAPYRIE